MTVPWADDDWEWVAGSHAPFITDFAGSTNQGARRPDRSGVIMAGVMPVLA